MEIRFARDLAEHQAAATLAENAYRARGYVERLDAFDVDGGQVIVAVHDSTVLGTASVAGYANAPLPTASYFGLGMAEIAVGLDSRHVMEAGRLAISRTRHARALLCGLIAAMTGWAQARAYQLCLLTLKPCLHHVITGKLGIRLTPLATADELVPDRIPTASHGYFLAPDITERPSAFSIDLSAARMGVTGMRGRPAGDVVIAEEILGDLAAA